MLRRRCACWSRGAQPLSLFPLNLPRARHNCTEYLRRPHAEVQTAERVVGVELQMEHLSIAVEARISRLEGQQAATAQWQAEADRRHVQTNQRLASVEQQLAKGQQPTPVARQPAAHTSAATQRSAAAAPPSAVGRPERMAVAAAAMRRQPGQAGRGSAAVPGAAAVLPPLPPASSTPQPRPPKQPALRIGDHSFASRDAAWALIKQLKIDLLDKPMCWDDQERGASFRWAGTAVSQLMWRSARPTQHCTATATVPERQLLLPCMLGPHARLGCPVAPC